MKGNGKKMEKSIEMRKEIDGESKEKEREGTGEKGKKGRREVDWGRRKVEEKTKKEAMEKKQD